MAEYIEKSAILEAFTNAEHPIQYPSGSHGLGLGYAGFRTILFDLPAADVQPVVRGKWLHKEITDDFHAVGQCSVCKERRRIDNFCPNCGADMR